MGRVDIAKTKRLKEYLKNYRKTKKSQYNNR